MAVQLRASLGVEENRGLFIPSQFAARLYRHATRQN
jgi:hypothetical protein